MRMEVEFEPIPEWQSFIVHVFNLDADPPTQLDYYTEGKPTTAEVKAFTRDAFIKFQQFAQNYDKETRHRKGNGEWSE